MCSRITKSTDRLVDSRYVTSIHDQLFSSIPDHFSFRSQSPVFERSENIDIFQKSHVDFLSNIGELRCKSSGAHFGTAQDLDGYQVRFRVKVWGTFNVSTQDGESIRPTVKKCCAIIAILALSKGHRQSRKWLQAMLWSERDELQASNSLRQELARLKAVLGTAVQSDRFDIWLDENRFHFDHLEETGRGKGEELLQGFDAHDEAFEDWLREQRQHYDETPSYAAPPLQQKVHVETAKRSSSHRQTCTVIFDCSAKGNVEAHAAIMFFSELLHRKLDQYDFFICIGHENTGEAASSRLRTVDGTAVIVRVSAFANLREVCLGVQVDSSAFGPRLSYESVVLPSSFSQMRDATDIGRLVQITSDTLLDRVRYEKLPSGGKAEAILLAREACKNTFALTKESLAKADLLLTRAYELHPLGEYLAWRAFLRNTAFFQHRTTNIFNESISADALSIAALHEAPQNSLVQAFAAQVDYVNQGNVLEPLVRAEMAVNADKSDPMARALLSNALTVNGRIEEGLQVALQSVSLAAKGPYEFYFHHFACMAASALGEHEVGLQHARRSLSLQPHFVSPRRYQIVLTMQLGEAVETEEAICAMIAMESDFTVKTLLQPDYPVNTLRRLPLFEAVHSYERP